MGDPRKVTTAANDRVLADIDTLDALAAEKAAARARTAAAAERVLATACPAFDAIPQRRAVAVITPRPLPQPRQRWRATDTATAAVFAVYTTWAERRRWRRRRG